MTQHAKPLDTPHDYAVKLWNYAVARGVEIDDKLSADAAANYPGVPESYWRAVRRELDQIADRDAQEQPRRQHTMTQQAKHTPQAEALADTILKASGSTLRHYSMQKTRDEIFAAAQYGIDEAQRELLAALKDLADSYNQLAENSFHHGTTWRSKATPDHPYTVALAAIAKAEGR